jgi:hypothetical protein
MMNPTTRQMQLAAVPKLLPPSAMARDIPFDAACEVQGRLLAGLGQWGDRILVVIICGVHTALGEFYRAQHDRQLARRLPLAYSCSSSFPGQIGRAALLRTVQRDESQRLRLPCCPVVYFSTAALKPGPVNYPTTRQMQLAGCSPKAAFAAGNVPWHTVCNRGQGAGATSVRFGAVRWLNLCVIICRVHTALGDSNRAQHP